MQYWRRHGRHDLPWRQTTDPYAIVVSEIMLQQTQVPRVIDKFRAFIKTFPSFRVLARAPVRKVLQAWQGLGYNRRALNLQRLAQQVVRDHGGKLPDEYKSLQQLSGIGAYTAGAILAFAFNKPVPVIETNIRRVVIHHYFPRRTVDDRQILTIVERTLDRQDPRRWYSALMDYGTYLASQVPNPNRRSRQYTKQSKFEGSLRQLRGRVVARVTAKPVSVTALRRELPDDRLGPLLKQLEREGFLRRRGLVIECA